MEDGTYTIVVDLESYDCDMLNCDIRKIWNVNSRQEISWGKGFKNVYNRVI